MQTGVSNYRALLEGRDGIFIAFNSVVWSFAGKVLGQIGFPNNWFEILYQNIIARVKMNDIFSGYVYFGRKDKPSYPLPLALLNYN